MQAMGIVRKAALSSVMALVCLALLVFGVMAQGEPTPPTDETATPAVTVQSNAIAGNVIQTVPLTLTLTIPGPSGPMTVEVPVFLSLNIYVGISSSLTPTLVVTPSIVTVVEETPTATPAGTDETTPQATSESTAEVTSEATAEATSEGTVEAPAEEPTATPLSLTPTPEPVEVEATATEEPLPTATPTNTPEPMVIAPACADPRAIIVAPGVDQIVSGIVNILGTATHENFQYYKIEYASGANIGPDGAYAYLGGANAQVTGGLLASFDSTILDNGAYTLKLMVVDRDGNFPPPCTVTVVVAN